MSTSDLLPVTSARLLIVEPLGCVDALLETRPPQPAVSPYYSTATTYESLASVLHRRAWHIAGDTPIARLDVVPFHEGRDFVLLGPTPAAYLPAGAVRPARGPRYVYSGQRWDTLGMLTFVSIDVYLALVCQVGGTVALAGTYQPGAVTTEPARIRPDGAGGQARTA